MSEGEERILLAHGGGGRLSRDLVDGEIVPRFGDGPLAGLPDAATVTTPAGERLVFTTDSFVVQPVFFPGGNIGDLAVHGTVNDISVAGGRPVWLSLGIILEEGLALADLRLILDSVRAAAAACGVKVVTGDTKVVPRGQCDGIYINTSGIGVALAGYSLGLDGIVPGDRLIVSGGLAEHGFAVLAARNSIAIGNGPKSDTGPVNRLVSALQPVADKVRFMRDPTRGGLASVLNEIVDGRSFGAELDEQSLPLSPGVRAVAELLGMDPLHVASEGRVLMVCAPEVEARCLEAWRALPEGRGAARIGTVSANAGTVVMRTLAGGSRLVDMPRGELLPRIC